MEIKKGQIWISKTESYKSIRIIDIGYIYENEESDESKYCLWEIYDEKAWDKFVLEKKFKGIGTIEEHIQKGKNTFPYACYGECSFKSMKQRIRKNKLELLNIK